MTGDRRPLWSYANDAGPPPRRNEKDMTTATHPQVDPHESSLRGARAWFAEKGLSRPRQGRVLSGVSAGLARRYDVNPLVSRLLVIAAILVLTPLAYLGAWVLMPADVAVPSPAPSAA
jgi:phage shock protein PspC (stress-responsive transcriptional regulator)